MTRNLTTAIKNELATNDIRPIHLITIGFSTPINITDCSFPLTSSISGSSVTYSASDFILGISNHTEETDITKSTVSINLSGADQTFISTVLSENVINDSVTIYRGLLADDNSLIVVYQSYLIGQTLEKRMEEKQTIHLNKDSLVQMLEWILLVKQYKILNGVEHNGLG
jgi:hypothetical protein